MQVRNERIENVTYSRERKQNVREETSKTLRKGTKVLNTKK